MSTEVKQTRVLKAALALWLTFLATTLRVCGSSQTRSSPCSGCRCCLIRPSLAPHQLCTCKEAAACRGYTECAYSNGYEWDITCPPCLVADASHHVPARPGELAVWIKEDSQNKRSRSPPRQRGTRRHVDTDQRLFWSRNLERNLSQNGSLQNDEACGDQ